MYLITNTLLIPGEKLYDMSGWHDTFCQLIIFKLIWKLLSILLYNKNTNNFDLYIIY